MFLDRAVRTTSHPSVATVCALLVLLLATGTVFGLEDSDENPASGSFEEGTSEADSTDASALPESLGIGPAPPADLPSWPQAETGDGMVLAFSWYLLFRSGLAISGVCTE